MATHSVFLLGKFHGQRSLVGYSPWGSQRSQTRQHTHAHVHTCVCAHTHTLFHFQKRENSLPVKTSYLLYAKENIRSEKGKLLK